MFLLCALCRTGWLHALTFTQNLYAVSDMCTTWTWYLANDMQYYALMLLLLYVYAKHPRFAIGLFTMLLAVAIAICFAVCLHFEIVPK